MESSQDGKAPLVPATRHTPSRIPVWGKCLKIVSASLVCVVYVVSNICGKIDGSQSPSAARRQSRIDRASGWRRRRPTAHHESPRHRRADSIASRPVPTSFGERETMPHFRVTYAVSAPDEAGARAIVDALCLEQTVELPLALVPPGTWINEHVVAKCESLCRRAIQPKHPEAGDVRWEAVVRYSDDTAGGELPQLLNVIFGNTSIKENVMVLDVALSPTLTNKFLGPRFGTAGLREILGVPKGPMLMTALKPMGSSVTKLAEMAYLFAKGGIDVIKDDHGLANQRYAPYEERVRACCAAVRRANAETGRKCVYALCLNAPAHLVVSRAKFAKAAGAGAVLMIPGITGLDSARALAEDPEFNLPIICHPAILGAMLGGGSKEECRGFSHKALLGILPRLAGCDATIFPSFGGRFGFSVDECKEILAGCRAPMGSMPSILPCPGGGMTLERVDAMRREYGDDVCFLIGGSLIGHSPDLVANAKHFMKIAGRPDHAGGPLETNGGGAEATTAASASGGEDRSTGRDDELERLRKQVETMEKNLEQVTNMYLSSEAAAKAARESAAAGSGADESAHRDGSVPSRPKPGETLPPGVAAPNTPWRATTRRCFTARRTARGTGSAFLRRCTSRTAAPSAGAAATSYSVSAARARCFTCGTSRWSRGMDHSRAPSTRTRGDWRARRRRDSARPARVPRRRGGLRVHRTGRYASTAEQRRGTVRVHLRRRRRSRSAGGG